MSTGIAAVGAVGLAIVAILAFNEPPNTLGRRAADMAAQKANAEQTGRIARQAISQNPYDARAIRALALVAESDGDDAAALLLMNLGDRINRRDMPTQAWLFERSMKDQNYGGALTYADNLLRIRPKLIINLHEFLISAAADPTTRPQLAKMLEARPFWRQDFITLLTSKADPAVAFALLSSLGSENRPTDAEVSLYIAKLIRLGRYEEALLGWMLFMPTDRLAKFSGLYDGEFDGAPGPQPFNWHLESRASAFADLAAPPGRPTQKALRATFDGQSKATIASQLLVLTPGPHVLNGEILPGTGAPENLAWKIVCKDSGEIVLTASPAGAPGWSRFAASFEVPATGCVAQTLSLEGEPGDNRAPVEAWYDNITIGDGAS